MTNESILISEVIPATPQRIFSAWMDSAQHSAFTGDEATLVNEVGGELRAAGGYIQGRTLELNEGSRIVQSWRTTEFPPESPDSRVEITLEPTLGGTLVTLLHTDIPVGQGDRYRQGWNEYYLSRMKAYFSDGDQTSSDLAGMRGKIHDADAEIDDDTDDAVLDLDGDGDDGDDTQLEVSIAEADVITSVGERPGGEGQSRARSAPGGAHGATKLKAAPKAAARPTAKPIKLAAKSVAKSAKAPVKKAKAAVSASARKAAKKAPKAAARRSTKRKTAKTSMMTGKMPSKAKGASARRAAKPGKAKVVAKARVKPKAKAKPKAVKARSKPTKDRKAKVAKGRAKGSTPVRARR